MKFQRWEKPEYQVRSSYKEREFYDISNAGKMSQFATIKEQADFAAHNVNKMVQYTDLIYRLSIASTLSINVTMDCVEFAAILGMINFILAMRYKLDDLQNVFIGSIGDNFICTW